MKSSFSVEVKTVQNIVQYIDNTIAMEYTIIKGEW